MFGSLSCAARHAGALYTNTQIVDVGTGGAFEVPSLVGAGAASARARPTCTTVARPTLADRFGQCGGGAANGGASGLTAAQASDLVAFLQTL